jgi:glycosyltransferase involved in cell wall biosynthesis
MKIFFPLEVFYPSQAGGPANSIYWIVKNLAKSGIKSTLVATDKGIKEGFQLNKWIHTDFGKANYIQTKIYNIPLKQIFIALREIKKHDVIHLSSVFFPTAFLSAFFARYHKKKIILSPRGELDPSALQYSRFKKIPVLWLIKKILGKYPLFHSTCSAETLYLKNTFGEEIKVIEIPNFIEMPEFYEEPTENYLLFIGRIHPKKAIDNLIRALANSEKFLDSDFVLKIAGRGDSFYETELKELVRSLDLEKKIEFLGQVEGDAKQKLFTRAYFTIMPSHTENFGNVVLESLAQQTPVIASKGTPWEVLEKEKIGYWVDNSVENLTDTINKVLRLDQSIYRNYRNKCRSFVEEDFDVVTNIHKWVEVYQNLG